MGNRSTTTFGTITDAALIKAGRTLLAGGATQTEASTALGIPRSQLRKLVNSTPARQRDYSAEYAARNQKAKAEYGVSYNQLRGPRS